MAVSSQVLADYAALADEVYRKSRSLDQGFLAGQATPGDPLSPGPKDIIGGAFQAYHVASNAQSNLGNGLLRDPDGFYYSDSAIRGGNQTGFVGRILQDEAGNFIVVYRGSDAGDFSFRGALVPATLSYLGGGAVVNTGATSGRDISPGKPGKIDQGDINSNFLLSQGRLATTDSARSQIDDALALASEALRLANGDVSRVHVVGQSLGGGLAGVVSAALGVEGYLFDAAPFAKQATMEVSIAAIASQTGLSFLAARDMVKTWSGIPSTIEPNGSVNQATGLDGALQGSPTQFRALLGVNLPSQFSPLVNNIMDQRDAQLAAYGSRLHIETISGEALSGGTGWTGFGIKFGGAAAFPVAPNFHDVGVADEWALHNPSLLALQLRSGVWSEQQQSIWRAHQSR
jgi:hypothetical protein